MAEPMKSRWIGKQACRLLAPAALLFCSAAALAQDASAFPNRPVKIITPTAAGGNIDILARTLAGKLGSAWGQGVVVEPRPGANGMIAASFVAKAPADGYTILFSHSALVQNLLLQPNPPYKLADFLPPPKPNSMKPSPAQKVPTTAKPGCRRKKNGGFPTT